VISGFPTGATFSEGALSGDQWTISDPAQIAALATTPLTMTSPADFTGSFTLEVEAVAAGNTTVTQDFAVTVSAPAHWVGASDDWTTSGSDWSTGSAPATGTHAVIDASETYTVTITSADVAQSLTIDAAGATVSDESGGSLALGGALAIAAGEFDLAGGALLATSIDVANSGSFIGYGALQSSVHNDGTIEASGAGLHIAGAVTGTGAFTIDDGATLEFGSSVGIGTTVSFDRTRGHVEARCAVGFRRTNLRNVGHRRCSRPRRIQLTGKRHIPDFHFLQRYLHDVDHNRRNARHRAVRQAGRRPYECRLGRRGRR
jgi:hypothetical protein